jgi:hypothetical protein
MSHSKIIRLRFQRDNNNSSKDDIIRITYIGERKAVVSYSYYATDTHATKQVMSHNMLTNYLSSMFFLIAADMDPFQAVQIDMPLMPSVCLPPNRLSWEAHNILKQIDLLFDGWVSAEDDIFAEEESLEASSVEDEEAAEDEDDGEEDETEDKNKICADLNNARIEDNININANNEFNIPSIPDYRTWPNGNHHVFYSAT